MATLGELAVGSIVKLSVNGTAKNFIVIQQGKPSTKYDSSCTGTWLMMEDLYTDNQNWYNTNNDYSASQLNAKLNSTFLAMLSSGLQDAIKEVKIPYTKGTGSGGTLQTGSSGFTTKVFALSYTEVGLSGGNANVEGTKLAYFKSDAKTKRIAHFNGKAKYWWLRSPDNTTTNSAWYVNFFGVEDVAATTKWYGVRATFILPSTLSLIEPTAPGIPSFSEPKGGEVLTVSWTAASDEDGNLSGYTLEVQLNGGSWTQVYKGSAQTYSYTVPDSTNTIAFRVKAYDSYGAESAYATSATAEVSSGGISGALNVNGVVYELTGEGYVNINGVLCEIVDSYVDIDGVLKSLSGGTDRVKLPDGYTQVEYIQSSGTQYIDTGHYATQNTKVTADAENMDITTSEAPMDADHI